MPTNREIAERAAREKPSNELLYKLTDELIIELQPLFTTMSPIPLEQIRSLIAGKLLELAEHEYGEAYNFLRAIEESQQPLKEDTNANDSTREPIGTLRSGSDASTRGNPLIASHQVIEESQGQQEPSAPHPASLTALRKWEEAAGGRASASEGNAFIDGFNAGFEHRLETEYQRGRSDARDELSGDTRELRDLLQSCVGHITKGDVRKCLSGDHGECATREELHHAERVLAQGESR